MIFKGAINLFSLRVLLNLKHKSNIFVSQTIILTLILTFIYYLKILEDKYIYIIGIICSSLLLIFYFYLIHIKKKVRKLEKANP